jgi:anion-transporting  ArsA/GET3 family ATPase
VSLLDRRLLVVTGKGGVGKTAVAAALARSAARAGKRVLLCETDRSDSTAGALGVRALTFDPTAIDDRLDALSIDTEASMREYLKLILRVPIIAKVTPIAKALDFVATAAPGVREILTIGKVCHEVRRGHYDLVVMDAAASGHAVSQLDVARVIHDAVPAGPLHSQTRWMLEILTDSARSGVVVVTTPEELPVSETVELLDRLSKQSPVSTAAVVVNRLVPEVVTRADEAAFAAYRTKAPKAAERVVAAAAVLADLRDHAVDTLARLSAGPMQIVLPEVFAASAADIVSQLADRLTEEQV